MNEVFGYIRVSTARQGEQGVSLQQQRDAIERYAARYDLKLVRWFEEQETAARRGRPVFSKMIALLKRGTVRGVVIHKIDRSARNLRDWSELGELIDRGIEVHFANESLDLHTRGGRLSADIQAVVAADFIRNLKEETKKGIYGRLKQGLFPMPAPIGYLNRGAGKPKVIDPVQGPLMRAAFELYASGRFNYHTLADELFRMGLRGRNGRRISSNRMSFLLNNTFYMGLITIKKTGETYAGAHEPLITRQLFERVQDVIHGRTNTRPLKHDFLFRRRVKCRLCGFSLIGELHKSHIYYRCQTQACPTTCVREEIIDQAILNVLLQLRLNDPERRFLKQQLAQLLADEKGSQARITGALELRIRQSDERLNRLTDAYIDRLIEKELYEQRKKALLLERLDAQETIKRTSAGQQETLAEFLEHADSAYLAYKTGTVDEKRRVLEAVTSNRTVAKKSVEIKLLLPFQQVADRFQCTDGTPRRSVARIWEPLLRSLAQLIPALRPKDEPDSTFPLAV